MQLEINCRALIQTFGISAFITLLHFRNTKTKQKNTCIQCISFLLFSSHSPVVSFSLWISICHASWMPRFIFIFVMPISFSQWISIYHAVGKCTRLYSWLGKFLSILIWLIWAFLPLSLALLLLLLLCHEDVFERMRRCWRFFAKITEEAASSMGSNKVMFQISSKPTPNLKCWSVFCCLNWFGHEFDFF